jgi:hypothetical protein
MDMVAFVVGVSSQSGEADISEAMHRQFQRPVFDIMSTHPHTSSTHVGFCCVETEQRLITVCVCVICG